MDKWIWKLNELKIAEVIIQENELVCGVLDKSQVINNKPNKQY